MTNQPNPNKDKMIELRGQGLSYGSISKLVGISRARVHQICSGYQSANNQVLKKFILKRDNYICQWGKLCKNKALPVEDLVVHHIDFNDENNSIKNLITLCKFCHASFHATNHIDNKILKNLKPKKKIRECVVCGKQYLGGQRKTCSRDCQTKKLKKFSDEQLKARHKEQMAIYYNKVKNNPQRKVKQRAYAAEYFKKNKVRLIAEDRKQYWSNPEFYREKYRKYYREHYSKQALTKSK